MSSASAPSSIYQHTRIMDEIKQVYTWLDTEACSSKDCAINPCCADILMDVRNVFQNYRNDFDGHRLFDDFYALLPRLERSYYLASFRIRRWLSDCFSLRVEDLRSGNQTMEVSLDTTRKSFCEIKNDAQIDYLCVHNFTRQPSEIGLKVIVKN